MPNLPWKSPLNGTNRSQEAVEDRAMKRILKDPERFAKAVEDPALADLVAERVAEAPATRWRAEDAIKTRRDHDREATAARPTPQPASAAVEKVVAAITGFFDTEITHNGMAVSYRDSHPHRRREWRCSGVVPAVHRADAARCRSA